MLYTFNKTDSGIIGKAFEMAIKDLLNRKNANRVSPCGTTDFRYNAKNYEVKQNGSCIQYHEGEKIMKGSNRIIYATHVAHTIIEETETHLSIEIDLESTEFFVLDREKFIEYLKATNGMKVNESRGTMNIQTMYNYKKDAYHGKRGKDLEKWARANGLQDDILEILFDKIYTDEGEA